MVPLFLNNATEKHWIFIYKTSSPSKLRFAQQYILGKWLYNVTKGVDCDYSVLKSSVGCSKVCGNDCPRSVQSGDVVAEWSGKPLSAIICLMKWGATAGTSQLKAKDPSGTPPRRKQGNARKGSGVVMGD